MPDWAMWLIAGVAGFVVLKSAGGAFAGIRNAASSFLKSAGGSADGGEMLTLDQAEAIAVELGITDQGQRFRLFMLTEPRERRERIKLLLELKQT